MAGDFSADRFLGTSAQGIYKSTDCGTSWEMINTGVNGLSVGTGGNWGLKLDPVDTDVLYTRVNDSFWKSENGGVDWKQLWPSGLPELNDIVDSNAVNGIDIDPDDHTHVLLNFRYGCHGDYGPMCFGESTNSGETWTIRNGDPAMVGNDQGRLHFVTSEIWIFSSGNNGLWRTTNQGTSWLQLADKSLGGIKSDLYKSDIGTYYFGYASGVIKSTDGLVWTTIPNSGIDVGGLVGDGENLYKADRGICDKWNDGLNLYSISDESSGTSWTLMDTPVEMNEGSIDMAFDRDHRILFTSNCRNGFWRLRTEE
jgi:hypothetical protein